ncbi:hypothetical protein [Noviherbaspirillum autotrophicum]|nr:hypothetical protein [Noviherbaspirillum autotrophicum]
MVNPIQSIAIVVAFFFAYVVPMVALFALGGIGASGSDSGSYSATWLSFLLVTSYVICPVVGGYLAARLAKQKTYIHALLVSVIAGITIGLMHEEFSALSTLMWISIFSGGGIVGAWIYERLLARRSENVF